MNIVRKINDELAIAGQVTFEQLQQIANDGYKSILNLRSLDENDFWDGEQNQAECLGLCYFNFPTNTEQINHQVAQELFQQIKELPKPTLIHCDNAMRSAIIVLMYIATKQGMALDKAFQKANNLSLI